MVKDQNVPDVGLEDIPLYINIRNLGITNVSTRLDIFPSVEVIGWIFPRADVSTMIISNTKGQSFASFTPAYISKPFKLPTP